MKITIIEGYSCKEQVYELFTEYTNMLIAGNNDFKEYLNKQNYKNELENIEEKYGFPYGRLYLAYADNVLSGCIALRKIDTESCELKRLYVKPEFREKGIAKLLLNKIIVEAKNIGYKYILLDTLPFLDIAINMYKSYGFYEIKSYNNNPMDDLIYMKYNL